MDKVVDPESMQWKNSNAEGADDRRMLPLFEQWLGTIEDRRTPFYAQVNFVEIVVELPGGFIQLI